MKVSRIDATGMETSSGSVLCCERCVGLDQLAFFSVICVSP